MTLKKLKIVLKVGAVSFVVFIYGLASFALGRSLPKNISEQIKEARTQSSLRSQIEEPQPYSDTQSSQVIASYVKLCSNTAFSFQLSYPKDWFTTYNDKQDQCTYFAPYSFVVPPYIEHDIAPIHVETVSADEWQTTVKLYENPNDFQNVISSKNVDLLRSIYYYYLNIILVRYSIL